MPTTNDKNSEIGGAISGPDTSGLVMDRRIELPKSYRGKSIHEIWGAGGPARLIRQLAQEHKLGPLAPLPLTNEELAELVELYGDEQPSALREVVMQELRNQRRKRPGPDADLRPYQRLEWHLLPILHERFMRVAAWRRRRLVLIEKRKKRWEPIVKIPTQAALAMRFVRLRLPWTRALSDSTLANKLSAIKGPSDKKPRAKAAKS
jgi:hypothetical protein